MFILVKEIIAFKADVQAPWNLQFGALLPLCRNNHVHWTAFPAYR
jgi:hypothetical protein